VSGSSQYHGLATQARRQAATAATLASSLAGLSRQVTATTKGTATGKDAAMIGHLERAANRLKATADAFTAAARAAETCAQEAAAAEAAQKKSAGRAGSSRSGR
jgi:hypothetical protein